MYVHVYRTPTTLLPKERRVNGCINFNSCHALCFCFRTLTTMLTVFSSFHNPRAFYKESELRQLYMKVHLLCICDQNSLQSFLRHCEWVLCISDIHVHWFFSICCSCWRTTTLRFKSSLSTACWPTNHPTSCPTSQITLLISVRCMSVCDHCSFFVTAERILSGFSRTPHSEKNCQTSGVVYSYSIILRPGPPPSFSILHVERTGFEELGLRPRSEASTVFLVINFYNVVFLAWRVNVQ